MRVATRDTKRAPFRHSHRWAALPRRDDRDAVGGARNWGADGAVTKLDIPGGGNRVVKEFEHLWSEGMT